MITFNYLSPLMSDHCMVTICIQKVSSIHVPSEYNEDPYVLLLALICTTKATLCRGTAST